MSGMKARIDIRVPVEMRSRLDEWRKRQEFPITESAAIRYAIERLLDRVRKEGGE